MSEQLYDFLGEMFQRYFRPAIGTYPWPGTALVQRWLTLTDDVPDRLAQTRRAALAWGKTETSHARITSELLRDHPTRTDVCRRVERVAPGAVLPGHAARKIRVDTWGLSRITARPYSRCNKGPSRLAPRTVLAGR
jgi:hypothetical protein